MSVSSDHVSKQSKAKKRPRKITEKYLRNSGLHYLSRYPASAAHFEFVMMRKIKKSIEYHKEPSFEDAQKYLLAMIEDCQTLGLINDKAYAHALYESYRRRGYGRTKIKSKLIEKKLPSDVVKSLLEQNKDENEEYKTALLYASKRKLGPFANDENKKTGQKPLAALARAGFSYTIAQRVLEYEIEYEKS